MSVWNTEEWKAKAAEFVKDKFCVWCFATANLVPHHPKKLGGYTREEYLSLDGCIVLCGKCNFMEDKGYKICPVCHKRYYKPKRGRLPMCFDCFSGTSLGKSVKEYYEKHPEELKEKLKKRKTK